MANQAAANEHKAATRRRLHNAFEELLQSYDAVEMADPVRRRELAEQLIKIVEQSAREYEIV